jgi:hypothetical protein
LNPGLCELASEFHLRRLDYGTATAEQVDYQYYGSDDEYQVNQRPADMTDKTQ